MLLLGGGAFFCLLAAHPFVTYPLSLWLLSLRARPRHISQVSQEKRPSVAICMSAFNEESVIEAKIESLLGMVERYGNATVHVYADAPTDKTVEILQRYADRIDLVVSPVRTGKTFGMNTLVARSASDLILFTDANVVNSSDVIGPLVAPFADPDVGCTCAQLVYSNHRESPTAATGAVYWAIEEWIKRAESRSVGMIGVDGAMFVMRRALHRPPPPHLIDDLYLSLVLLIGGARVVSVDEVKVYERSAVTSGEEFARKLRIACQAINVHRALWPELRRMPALPLYGYISHRLIKWLTPFVLVVAGLCFLLAGELIFGARPMLLGIAATAIVLVAGQLLRIRPIVLVSATLINLSGVGIGVLQSLFSKRTYTVWKPAASVREEVTDGVVS